MTNLVGLSGLTILGFVGEKASNFQGVNLGLCMIVPAGSLVFGLDALVDSIVKGSAVCFYKRSVI